ncbi:MAG: cytochrome c-type biogenesis protein CcmH [Planctomycetes bacterium]|nr:cytochrome c-type biogenesis protein CcmH [Planctomycetota bacterium]
MTAPAIRARAAAAPCLITLIGALRAPAQEAEIVEAFLSSVKGSLGAPGSEAGVRPQVRALLGEVEARAAEREPEPAKRIERAKAARGALLDGLAAVLGGAEGPARAEALLAAAEKEHMQARVAYLERSLICWCPDESWTRTLAGCPDGCAEEQKRLIKDWIGEGLTDREVVERMAAHPKGGPKVRAVPEAKGANWVGYLFPFVAFGAAAALVAVLLRRLTRRTSGGGPAPGAQAEASADDAIGEGIERELREMEG